MSYRRSLPLERWLGPRREVIDTLATGHAAVGGLKGPGRPLDVSKPLAHAYVIVALAQFQGFIRDLHDLAVEEVVSGSGATAAYVPLLIEGVRAGRAIDRANPTHRNIKDDFARLGLSPLDISAYNRRWESPGDAREMHRLIALRNAVGHGHETVLQQLLAGGQVRDTVGWVRDRLPVLNRYARALDRLLWDHVEGIFGKEPW